MTEVDQMMERMGEIGQERLTEVFQALARRGLEMQLWGHHPLLPAEAAWVFLHPEQADEWFSAAFHAANDGNPEPEPPWTDALHRRG
jgi:hypothetical protein